MKRLHVCLVSILVTSLLFFSSALMPVDVHARASASSVCPPYDPNVSGSMRQGDCLALVQFYYDTGGPSWINQTGWLTDAPPCSWFGVSCTTWDPYGYVWQIEMPNNGLAGPLTSVANMSMLHYLKLAGNSIVGNLTPLCSHSFAYISLNNNNLSGEIPSCLGSQSELWALQVANNQLTGKIPPVLANIITLRELWLQQNYLDGDVPDGLGHLVNLYWLQLNSNQLRGPIPASLGNLVNLASLGLANNQLTGTIPLSLGNLVNLDWLTLDNNQLTGSIPPEFGKLTSLRMLGLSANKLTGAIPAELGQMTSLNSLVLDHNTLTGGIPSQLGNLTNLTHLNLSFAGLSGQLPASLGNLINLKALYLANNQFRETLPDELGNLKQLETIDLQGNPDLAGPLPKGFLDSQPMFLHFDDTNLCVPQGDKFKSWLSHIGDLLQSGITCEPPVLLIHGYCSGSHIWGNLARELKYLNFVVRKMDLGGNANGDIWGYGVDIKQKITEIKDEYGLNSDQKIDIVAHSMGGLASRAYALESPTDRNVRDLIMLGTPNNGSGLFFPRYHPILRAIALFHNICQGTGPAADQMTPGSPFLKTVNSAGMPPSIESYTTIAGTQSWLLTNWILRSEPNDGVVEMDSVQSVGGESYSYPDDHFTIYENPLVWFAIAGILRDSKDQISRGAVAQQSASIAHEYQEAPLIAAMISLGQENNHSTVIDPTASRVRFVLASSDGALSLNLTAPDGRRITPAIAASDPAITYTQEFTSLIGYEIDVPQSGTWMMHVMISETTSSSVSYALYTMMDSDLRLSSPTDSLFSANQPLKLTAHLTHMGTAFSGANAEANIRNTTGISQTLPLYDDGTHGDIQANDGIYTTDWQPDAETYDVTLQASGMIQGQPFIREREIKIWAPPLVAAFSAAPTLGSVPLSVQFTDQTAGAVTTRIWTFGDGGTSSEQHPSHQYAVMGVYTVTLSVSGPGGSDSERKISYIQVTDTPVALTSDFDATPTSGKAPLAVQFSDRSGGTITSWQWSFGDGGTSDQKSPSHIYTLPGVYPVSLTVSGQGGSNSKTVAGYIVVTQPDDPDGGSSRIYLPIVIR